MLTGKSIEYNQTEIIKRDENAGWVIKKKLSTEKSTETIDTIHENNLQSSIFNKSLNDILQDIKKAPQFASYKSDTESAAINDEGRYILQYTQGTSNRRLEINKEGEILSETITDKMSIKVTKYHLPIYQNGKIKKANKIIVHDENMQTQETIEPEWREDDFITASCQIITVQHKQIEYYTNPVCDATYKVVAAEKLFRSVERQKINNYKRDNQDKTVEVLYGDKITQQTFTENEKRLIIKYDDQIIQEAYNVEYKNYEVISAGEIKDVENQEIIYEYKKSTSTYNLFTAKQIKYIEDKDDKTTVLNDVLYSLEQGKKQIISGTKITTTKDGVITKTIYEKDESRYTKNHITKKEIFKKNEDEHEIQEGKFEGDNLITGTITIKSGTNCIVKTISNSKIVSVTDNPVYEQKTKRLISADQITNYDEQGFITRRLIKVSFNDVGNIKSGTERVIEKGHLVQKQYIDSNLRVRKEYSPESNDYIVEIGQFDEFDSIYTGKKFAKNEKRGLAAQISYQNQQIIGCQGVEFVNNEQNNEEYQGVELVNNKQNNGEEEDLTLWNKK